MENAERKEYLDERKLLIDTQKESASLWDKTILTLSASALGFSLSFVKGNETSLICNPIIIISWICFGLAIILILINMLTFQKYITQKLNSLDEQYSNGDIFLNKYDAKLNQYLIYLKNLNIISLLSFISGIIFLILFISINFQGVKTMSNQDQKIQNEKFVDTTKTLEGIKKPEPIKTTTNTSTKK